MVVGRAGAPVGGSRGRGDRLVDGLQQLLVDDLVHAHPRGQGADRAVAAGVDGQQVLDVVALSGGHHAQGAALTAGQDAPVVLSSRGPHGGTGLDTLGVLQVPADQLLQAEPARVHGCRHRLALGQGRPHGQARPSVDPRGRHAAHGGDGLTVHRRDIGAQTELTRALHEVGAGELGGLHLPGQHPGDDGRRQGVDRVIPVVGQARPHLGPEGLERLADLVDLGVVGAGQSVEPVQVSHHSLPRLRPRRLRPGSSPGR